MLTEFPEFKKVDILDKELVESFTCKFLPYSDFNFSSLWMWDKHEECLISKLNNNLVILFANYETGEPLLSFLGNNDVDNTVETLLNYAESIGINQTLSYIPEEVSKIISYSKFSIQEDLENFDYIFSTKTISNPIGRSLKSKRHSAKRFERENPHVEVNIQNSIDGLSDVKILDLFVQWNKNKLNSNGESSENERKVLERLIFYAKKNRLVISTIILNEKLVAFGVDEILTNGYAISHFIKADITYKGIYEFLNERIAKFLLLQGVDCWNWEQDLGITGLHNAKSSYKPISMLKKYKINRK